MTITTVIRLHITSQNERRVDWNNREYFLYHKLSNVMNVGRMHYLPYTLTLRQLLQYNRKQMISR